jgi:hypothetical protein
MSATLAAALSLLSAVVVALIGHLLTNRRDRRNELSELRLRAYSDFINAASRLVSARRIGKTEDELGELAVLNAAKAQICICAEASVVEALTKFCCAGGTLEKESEILAFTRLCERMRESVGNRKRDIAVLNVSDMLFRLEPSSYSFRAEGLLAAKSGQQGAPCNHPTAARFPGA